MIMQPCYLLAAAITVAGLLLLPQTVRTAVGQQAHQCVGSECVFSADNACQCDYACEQYGDCCPDFADSACKPDLTSCAENTCAYSGTASCQCDHACVDYGDCCPDHADQPCWDGTDTTTTEAASTTTETMTTAPTTAAPNSPTTTAAATTTTSATTTATATTTTSATAVTTTTASEGSCAGRACTFSSSAVCQCDDLCEQYGDCCPDYFATCGQTTTTPYSTTTTPSEDECGFAHVLVEGVCVEYYWEVGPSDALPAVPIPVTEVSAVVHDDHIFVTGAGKAEVNAHIYTYAFNLLTSEWEEPMTRALRPFTGDHTTIEIVDGKAYAFAGLCCQSACDGCNATSKLQIYDPETDSWEIGPQIPWIVEGSISSAVIGGKIYLTGGIANDAPTALGAVFDPVTMEYTMIADMPLPVHHTAAGTDGSKLYVFGGRGEGNWVSDNYAYVQVYDPATDEWETSKEGTINNMPLTGRSGLGKAVFLGGEFYVMGGEAHTSSNNYVTDKGTFDLVQLYNPETNTWRPGPPLPVALHGLHPVIYDNQIYIAGGGPYIGGHSSDTFMRYTPRF